MRTRKFSSDCRSGSWQECLEVARHHASVMEFEASIECCLNFLHQHLIPPPTTGERKRILNSLSIVFACGGNGSRWDNFLELPKQMVDTGDGLPLVKRTINQFNARVEGTMFSAIIRKESQSLFEKISDIPLVHRQDSLDRPVAIEILTHASKHIPADRDLLFAFGDVYFSDSAVETILNSISAGQALPCFFGRKFKNDAYGNTGGEVFAVFVPATLRDKLLAYCNLIKRLYIGTPIHRCSTWEVASLASAMIHKSVDILPDPQLLESSVAKTYEAVTQRLHERDFDERLWVEINDETEDFDFPCEYIERVFRTVGWVGRALDHLE